MKRVRIINRPQPPMLYSRTQARQLLGGVSADLLIALERSGRLRPIRLTVGAKNAPVYYRAESILALADGDGDE